MFARLSVAFVAVALVVPVGAALSDSAWATSIGLDVLNESNRDAFAAGNEETRDLDAQSVEVHRRIEVKEASIRNLIAGRITLAEISAQFLTLDADRPAYMAMLRQNHKGSTDLEKMARNIISYSQPSLSEEHTLFRRAAVLVRLESELRNLTSHQVASNNH